MTANRSLLMLSVAMLAMASVGCSMCSHCLDDDYSAFGGKWQRGDMKAGRVGSVFQPAEMMAGDAGVVIEETESVLEASPGSAAEGETESVLGPESESAAIEPSVDPDVFRGGKQPVSVAELPAVEDAAAGEIILVE